MAEPINSPNTEPTQPLTSNLNEFQNRIITEEDLYQTNAKKDVVADDPFNLELKTAQVNADGGYPLAPNGEMNLMYPRGNKTIVCWNCLSVLMVKDEWNIIECSECHKFNRVPHFDKNTREQKITIQEDMNHFDLNMPYIFGIITCPFCQTENRFKRDADHIVCYKCHHSFNVKSYLNNYADINREEKINLNRPFNGYGHSYGRSLSMSIPNFPRPGFVPHFMQPNKIVQMLPIAPVHVFAPPPPKPNVDSEEVVDRIMRRLERNRIRNNLIYSMANPYLFPSPYLFPYSGLLPHFWERRRRNYDDDDDRRHNYRYGNNEYNKNDEAFKITIKKKKVNEDGKEISGKTKAFEKVLYTGMLK